MTRRKDVASLIGNGMFVIVMCAFFAYTGTLGVFLERAFLISITRWGIAGGILWGAGQWLRPRSTQCRS